MSIVNLVSGGLDSTLISVLINEVQIELLPLFVDYGQKAAQREWESCKMVHQQLKLPQPVKIDISGFGKIILSGLTSEEKDVREEAFTPGRNLLFILIGSAYAFQVGASAVSIGLLNEKYSIFPDQKQDFILDVERAIKTAMGKNIRVVTPLSEFSKSDVISLAANKGIIGTYSCHAGQEKPCGCCISCLELQGTKIDNIERKGR